MNTKMTNQSRVVIAVALFLFSVIVFGAIIAPAGFSIAEAGEEMSYIRSQAGNSIAEAYYQLHGEVYIGFGKVIAWMSIALCLGGCFVSGWIMKPIIASNQTKIDMFADDVKNRVARATQELSKPTADVGPAATEEIRPDSDVAGDGQAVNTSINSDVCKCAKCGSSLSEDSQFCTKCGTPVSEQSAEQKVCPSCGKPVAVDSAFCTKCGCKIG